MRLSRRIHALADSVIKGHTAADIGTDHGYVPMLLIREGISPRVIMSDISEGSLAKARETFRKCGLADRISGSDFRTGDGLETIEAGEVDEIIIGGLGGHTIVDILDADIDKSRSFRRLVLQPRKHSGALRYWLYVNGWDIESEQLAEEGKFACEIITAVPTDAAVHDDTAGGGTKRTPPYPEDDIRWKYPPSLADSDPELAPKRIGWKIGSIQEQIENMNKSSSEKDCVDILENDLRYLMSLLALCKDPSTPLRSAQDDMRSVQDDIAMSF